ncbi:endonuclease YncB(thermonuclease family) [Labrenzia sp. EL_195]|nr:endonuclease YncB(thermonuclease family) [Labrenzia sp. EL_195]
MIETATLIVCATLSVYDGDTLYCNGETMRPMGDGAPHVSGFDTPEIGPNADCDKERILGVTAAKRFQDLLLSPGVRIYDSGERDKTQSKRRLVWVVLPGGRTAGSILIEEGHARVWKPRHKNNWCD